MLDDEAKDKGYALMCVAEPQGDCTVAVIDEDELLEEVLQGAKQA
jgi:ferredoxin